MIFDDDPEMKEYQLPQYKNKHTDIDKINTLDFIEQKLNGNLNIAKEIGIFLGIQILSVNLNIKLYALYNISEFFSECEMIEKNKKILFFFAAFSAIENTIKNEYVLSATKSSMEEYLRTNDIEFYNTITSSINISLYMICKRYKKDDTNCYGKYFATLCNKKNNSKLITTGNMFYKFFYNLSKGIIKKYENICS